MAAPAANPIAEPPSFVNSKSCLNDPTVVAGKNCAFWHERSKQAFKMNAQNECSK